MLYTGPIIVARDDMAARDGASFTCRSCSTWPLVFGIFLIDLRSRPSGPCMAARVRPIDMHLPYWTRRSLHSRSCSAPVNRCRITPALPARQHADECRSCSTWPLVFGQPLVTDASAFVPLAFYYTTLADYTHQPSRHVSTDLPHARQPHASYVLHSGPSGESNDRKLGSPIRSIVRFFHPC